MKINVRTAFVCFVLILLIFSQIGRGQQYSLRGSVVDSITAQPVANASVYFANSAIGTATGTDGSFMLNNIPTGTYQLIVSTVGYKTTLKHVTVAKDETIRVLLSGKISQLNEVVIASPARMSKHDRKRWMDVFFSTVVGTSSFAKKCVIKNADDIVFQYSKKDSVLTAVCNTPLIIDNPALGYTVRYYLTGFRYNDARDVVTYSGIPYYLPQTGTARQVELWKNRRKAAYDISLLRFMRSVHRRSLMEDGYAMFWITGMKNTKAVDGPTLSYGRYFTAGVLFAAVDSTAGLTADSISRVFDQASVALDFRNVVLVNYSAPELLENKLLEEYAGEKWTEAIRGWRSTGVYAKDLRAWNRISSVLFLEPGKNVLVYTNGYYANGTGLNLMGLFSWLEKLGTMLPLDYYPEN